MFHVRFAVSMFILHENPHQFGKYDVILKHHELSTFIMPELLTNNQFQPWLTENPLRFHNQLLKNHGLEGQEPAFKYGWLLAFKGIPFPKLKFHHHRPDRSTSRPVDQVTCTVQSGGRLHPALQRPAPGRCFHDTVSP